MSSRRRGRAGAAHRSVAASGPPRLSRPLAQLRPKYDVVVVGSGYGGSVAALRTAEARKPDGSPVSVCLLERGAERWPGEYPDTGPAMVRQLRVVSKLGAHGWRDGMFRFHIGRGITTLTASGLGGGWARATTSSTVGLAAPSMR